MVQEKAGKKGKAGPCWISRTIVRVLIHPKSSGDGGPMSFVKIILDAEKRMA